MPTKNKALGDLGEGAAARHLTKQGLKIVARNWRCRFGELDIVAVRQEGFWRPQISEIVFVEVKSGWTGGQIAPEANIGPHKKQRLGRSINSFLAQHQDKIPKTALVKARALVVLFSRDYRLAEIKEYQILF